MEEPRPASWFQGEGWTDRSFILVLLVLVSSMRLWQMMHTEVTARDTIGFIRIAWQLEHRDWRQALRESSQHPGYPFSIMVVSRVVRLVHPGELPEVMQTSAQLASSLASVLLVFPMYWLGREMFSPRVSFWACVLFNCFPAAAEHMGDGLSEPLFLLLASSALLFAMRALAGGSVKAWFLAGVLSGAAFLTRPEGLVIAGATGLILAMTQLTQQWRRPLFQFVKRGAVLTIGAGIVACPYMLLIGNLTSKPSSQRILQGETAELRQPGNHAPTSTAAPFPLAIWWNGPADAPRSERMLWGLKALCLMLMRGFFHVAWIPALFALWRRRGEVAQHPGMWMQGCTAMVLAFCLFRVAAQIGYLSDRHAILIILCGVYWSADGIFLMGDALARFWDRTQVGRVLPAWTSPLFCTTVLLLGVALPGAYRSLGTLHEDREGFRQAGCWLAANTLPGDYVLDPYCWAHYYAGRVFVEHPAGPLPAKHPPVFYVVYENSGNKHARLKGNVAFAQQLIPQGQLVESWPVKRGRIEVWEVPGAWPFSH